MIAWGFSRQMMPCEGAMILTSRPASFLMPRVTKVEKLATILA